LLGLIAAMTLSGALLLILEPGPVSPPSTLFNLGAVAPSNDLERTLFDTTPAPQSGRWSAVVICESGSIGGTAQTIAAEHQAQGLGGLGYHFVIEDTPDTGEQVRAGFRWRGQLPGVVMTGPYRDWYNQHAVSICLVGNSNVRSLTEGQLRNLTNLVHWLQRRFDIPPNHVSLQPDIDPTLRPGRFFPLSRFRQSLLRPED